MTACPTGPKSRGVACPDRYTELGCWATRRAREGNTRGTCGYGATGPSQEGSPALPLPDRGESAERRTPIDRILVILGLCAFVPVMCLALVGLLLFGLAASADAWQTADYGGQAGRLVLFSVAVVALVLAAAIVSMKLGARFEALNDPPRYLGAWANPTWLGASTAVAKYLWEVHANLQLPPGIAEGALEAAATQIYEAIGDADPLGQHDEGVVMQVLSTFGQPIDAARRIKENQQLLPRPALGIAGGVVALVCGTVAAFLIVLPLTLPYELVRPSGSAEGAATDLFAVAVAFDFVTFYAARRTVRVSAAISRQMATRVGRWWAVVCIPLLAVPALLLVPQGASMPQAVAQLGIPVAFALGATQFVDKPWPIHP